MEKNFIIKNRELKKLLPDFEVLKSLLPMPVIYCLAQLFVLEISRNPAEFSATQIKHLGGDGYPWTYINHYGLVTNGFLVKAELRRVDVNYDSNFAKAAEITGIDSTFTLFGEEKAAGGLYEKFKLFISKNHFSELLSCFDVRPIIAGDNTLMEVNWPKVKFRKVSGAKVKMAK